MVYIIADVVGAYTIPRALEMPRFINHFINSVYYCLQIAFPALLLLYILAICGVQKEGVPLLPFAPFFVMEAIVLTNGAHGLVFRVDPALGYTRGPMYTWVYAACVFYVLLSLIALNRYKKQISRRQYVSITTFILLIVAASLVQFLMPSLLLSGPVIAVSLTMMYLTIQKPDDLLDVTTGVFNSTALMRMVDDLIAEKRTGDARRRHVVSISEKVPYIAMRWSGGSDFQATVLILNRVSRLNRLLGYESLNRLLAEMGRFLTTDFPRSWSFRLSGTTRFVVLTQSAKDYEDVLTRLRERFRQSWLPKEYDIVLPITILRLPTASMVQSADELSELINDAAERAADETEIELSADSLAAVSRRTVVESALMTAIEQDMLTIYMQPIYSVKTGAFDHAEALLRFPWKGALIPPSEFIPVAEQNGLILRIDELVFRKVCEFLRSCRPEGLTTVGVNLSAVEFLRADLTETLWREAQRCGVAPGLIALEMTETTASGPFATTKQHMETLKEKGFQFALDDYGTGFANISQVVRLPFDIVKLDRSILLLEGQRGDSPSVLRNSIRMFRELGVTIVAEDAETEADAQLLGELGVDYVQGYYFARPMPIPEYLRFMKRQSERNAERREVTG